MWKNLVTARITEYYKCLHLVYLKIWSYDIPNAKKM